MPTIAIGDIHGCYERLHELLTKCRRFLDGKTAKFVFLGDYIDRGPDSCLVVAKIMQMQAQSTEGSVIALRGNHEQMLLDAFQKRDNDLIQHWLVNGGEQTLDSYRRCNARTFPRNDPSWFKSLPYHNSDGTRLFVHAGIRPHVPLTAQSSKDLLWIREPFLSSDADHGLQIIHGHTPTNDRRPEFVQTGSISIQGPPSVVR